MLPDNFIKEQMSWTYLRTVVFRYGYNLILPVVDRGIDGTIEDESSAGLSRFDFQLKATTVYRLQGADIRYDLPVHNYNLLTEDDGILKVLILFIMPDDEGEWVSQIPDELCIRKCAYWVPFHDKAASINRSSVAVSVPLANVFDENGLQNIFGLI